MPVADSGSTPPVIGVVGRDLRAPRAAGVAGLLFSILFVAALIMVQGAPGGGSSAAEIEEWYLRGGARHLAIVGLYIVPFAGIAFLWFIAVIRSHVGDAEDRFFATVFLGSGLLFVAMLFAAAASIGAPLVSVKFQGAPVPGPDAIALARALGYTFLYVYAIRVAAVFVISVSTLGLRTKTLPRWLAIAGIVMAVLMLLSVSFFRFIVVLFPLWVAAVSIVILLTSRVPEGAGPKPAEPGA